MNEIFDAYFNVRKHGIIRNIPLKYTIDGKKFRIFLENIKVDGKKFSTYENNGEKEIKIWDPNIELIWNQRYSIHYSVYGLIRNFAGKGREELSWNVIPNGFDTHIDHVRVELNLPKVYTWFTSEDFLIAADGRSNKLEDFEGIIDWSQGDKIILTYDKTIPEGNWITLSVKFPVWYFTFDHERQESLIDKTTPSDAIKNFFTSYVGNSNIAFMILFIVGSCILIYFIIAVLINQFKRRFYVKSLEKALSDKFPIIIQYDTPKDLLPPEVGYLANDCVATNQQISSLFYKRLNEKYIDIQYNSEDKTITVKKLKTMPCASWRWHYYENRFFNNFFTSTEIVISKNKNFYYIFSGAQDSLYHCCLNNGFLEQINNHKAYDKNINLIPNSWWNIVFWGLICGLVLYSCPNNNFFTFTTVFFCLILRCLPLAFLITKNQTLLTEKWMQYKNHILWYKQFLETVDVPVLEKFLQQDPLYFDKIMPYVVALWLDTFLIKKFEPLLKKMNIMTPVVSKEIFSINDILCAITKNALKNPHSSSYDSDSGFSSGSSRDSGSSSWSSWGGWWWGGGRSW